METQWLPVSLVVWITALAGTLDARQQVRFVALCTGLLFARGRRTVASWLRGCGAGATTSAITTCSAASDARPWRSPGRCSASSLSGSRAMVRARRWSSPSTTHPPSGTGRTSRAPASITTQPQGRPGRNSSMATSGSAWPGWSDIRSGGRSPCRSSRTCTSEPRISAGWRRTTAGSSAPSWSWPPPRSSGWSSSWGEDHPPIWVVTDGAYAKRPFLKRVLAAGVTVISRLRCDAALRSLPVVVDPGQKKGRGRPPKYGKNGSTWPNAPRRHGAGRPGCSPSTASLVVKKYKTFLATYKPVGGVIRVVLVRELESWVAYFSTDPDLSVARSWRAVADRSALEQVFHDVKEVHGAGQQQLRHVWANVGAWNLIGWWHTLVELWAWNRPQARLRDRSDSPWDKPERRPSHANRCQELRREALQEEYSSLPSVAGLRRKIRRFIQRLMRRVA